MSGDLREMAALQMGVLCSDGGGYVLCRPGSLSSYGLDLKKNRMRRDILGRGDRKCCRPMSVSMRYAGSKMNADMEAEFKPSFGQYLKVMETVKVKRRERKEKSVGEQDFESREARLDKDGENLKVENVEVRKTGVQRVGGGVASVVKIRGVAVHKDLKDADIDVGYREDFSKRESGVNVRNDEGRGSTNARWTRNDSTVDKGERKATVWQNQGSPHARKSSMRVGKDLQSVVKRSPYDRQEGFSPKARTSDLRKGKFERSELQESFDRDNGGGFGSASRRIEMDYRNFRKSDNTALEMADDKSFVMERAAFKNVEVIDEGRVSRMLMEERLQRLAKTLNGADINMPEWMFSKTMRSAQIRFTDHSILRVIQILGKLGNWRRALQVIEWLQMSERFKAHKLRFIYTAALDVLGKARRPVEALNVFIAMQQQMSSYPDLVAYHSIAVTLGQAGHMKELFYVIDCMKSPPKKNFNKGVFEKWDPRLEPDIVVYNAVLNACVKRKNWEGAFWVLQQLDEKKIQVSSTTYGLVMEVMYACGKYNLVHEFFEKMKKSFIPNALTYRVLVNTLWKEGKSDEAVLAVDQMEKRGIVGSAALYYDLARCLCSMGRCKEALMQMEKICKVANKPLVVTYTGLIQACLDSGNTHDARFIFRKMHGVCSPNLVTYNIMLKAYVEGGLFEEAKELYMKMTEDGGSHRMNKSDIKDRVLPDIYTFNTLLDACSAAGKWDHFEYFFTEMLQYGFHFNAKRHLRMILDAARSNKGELVEMTWTHLAQSGRSPPVSLVLERFCLRLENGDVAAAMACITSLVSGDLGGNAKVGWTNLFKDNAHRFKQEAVDRLMNEIVRRQSESPNPFYGTLTACCKDFLRDSTYTLPTIVD